MQQVWADNLTNLVSSWGTVQSAQIDELAAAIENAVNNGNATALASIAATPQGDDLIMQYMQTVAEDAVIAAKAEAATQGVAVGTIDLEETVTPLLRARAQAVSALMARGISESAARQAALRYGVDTLTGSEVASAVRDHLESLSDTYLTDVLGGALTQAQNTGRRAVFVNHSAAFYASELMDKATCTVCAEIDGRQFATLAEADDLYPAGGNSECLGGPRCRGTIVAVYDEASPEGD
jgi:hypothetical protein